MIQMTPIFTGAIVGVVDGVVQKNDAAAPERAQLFQKWGTWYEAALLFGGMLADQSRMLGPQITEPLMLSGAVLLGKRVAEEFIQVQVGVPAYAIPQMAMPHATFGAVNKQPTSTLV